MTTDELSITRKVLTFIFFATLLADFFIGLTGSSINLPALDQLNAVSSGIQGQISYIQGSFTAPVGYPFNISQINLQSSGFLFGAPAWIESIGGGIVDIGYNIASVLINVLLLLASGFLLVLVVVFGVIPAIVSDLGIGALAPFLIVFNGVFIAYLGVVAYHIVINRFQGTHRSGGN